MTDLAIRFLSQLGQASIFLASTAVVAILVLRCLRCKSPAVHHITWCLVLVQGMLIFHVSLVIPWHKSNVVTETTNEAFISTALEPIQSGIPMVGPSNPEQVVEANEPSTSSILEIGENNEHIGWNWPILLLACWVGGIVVTLACWTVAYVRFVYAFPSEECEEQEWTREWQILLTDSGITDTIPMHVSSHVGPVLCRLPSGYRIVVPFGLWRRLTKTQRQCIMRHELAHYERSDVWKSLLMHLVALPHWFNPMTWLAVRRLEDCAEWACDDVVRNARREWSPSYAKALLAIGGQAGRQPAWTRATSGGGLSKRIRRIVSSHYERDSLFKKIFAFTMLLALIMVHVVRIELVAQEPGTEQINGKSLPSTSPLEEPAAEDTFSVAKPSLRFLSWRHNPPADAQAPIEGQYWLPSGERVVSQEILAPLGRVKGLNTEGEQGRFLHLFISHPGFRYGASAKLDILSPQGNVVDSLQRISPSRILYELPEKKWPGWMFFQIDMKPELELPPKGMVRLRYTVGTDSEELAALPVNATPGDSLDKGVSLLGIGESVDDKAFVSIFIERESAAKFTYFVTGFDKRGRPVRRDGTYHATPFDSAHALTFQFRQSLSMFSHFGLSRCPIREIDYRQVWFQPKAKN